MWAPATAVQFDKKLKAADRNSSLSDWCVDNIGITNGILDFKHDVPFYLDYAYNNTYGQFIDNNTYLQGKKAYEMEGGCRDQVALCQSAGDEGDALGRGTNETVNSLCQTAQVTCLPNFLIFPSLNVSQSAAN